MSRTSPALRALGRPWRWYVSRCYDRGPGVVGRWLYRHTRSWSPHLVWNSHWLITHMAEEHGEPAWRPNWHPLYARWLHRRAHRKTAPDG